VNSVREMLDQRELVLLGKMLDRKHRRLGGRRLADYLAESLLRVRGKDGQTYPLKANAVQREFERRRGRANIILKARQMGLTTWIAGRFLLKTITQPGTLTLQVAHTQESAEEILRIVHRFVEHLPPGLKAGVLKTSKSSVRQIVFPKMDSEYRVVSAGDRNAGRGMTVQNLHCSEVSRWGNFRSGDAAETLAGLRAALSVGSRAELVLESTPNGMGGCFYDEWQRADQTGLVRHFFPWWLEAGYRSAVPAEDESLNDEERELMLKFGLDLAQIGYRREMRANQQQMAGQEYVEDADTCFRASGEPFFDLEALERRMKGVPKPCYLRYGRQFEVWLPPQSGNSYVVAVDPAGGGVEGDWSVIQVIDMHSGMQCAEYAGHVTGPELADLVWNIASDYCRGWVAVERNNHGGGLLWLMEGKGYREIYCGPDRKMGFLTTSASRPQILARMSKVVVETSELFMSKKLLAECRSFVRLANGNVGARSGTHDDRVMSMAIGLAAREDLVQKPQVPGAWRRERIGPASEFGASVADNYRLVG